MPDCIPTDIYESISETVNSILNMKAKNTKYDTIELEKAIDKSIYNLYKLSEGDIAVVESKNTE